MANPFNYLGKWMPVPGATTGNTVGLPGLTAIGTPTAQTNFGIRQAPHVSYVSGSGAGSLAGIRASLAFVDVRSAFVIRFRIQISDAAPVSGARMFVGMTNTTSALTNVEPSTMTNCIGVGHGASDTNLMFYASGSTAGTPVDTGISLPSLYPLDVTLVMVSEVIFCSVDYGGGDIPRISTIAKPTFSSNLFTPLNSFRSNNATALPVSLDLYSYEIEMGVL